MKAFRVLLLGAACLGLSGCGLFTSAGKIDASVLKDPIEKVAARHDAYVQADESLSEIERRVYLRTTELLQELIREALEK